MGSFWALAAKLKCRTMFFDDDDSFRRRTISEIKRTQRQQIGRNLV